MKPGSTDAPIASALTAAQVIALLGLEPHPEEGGYFRETYRAAGSVPFGTGPDGAAAARSASTAIYYLLTPETFSHMHTVASDEVFHFYLGDPVEQLRIDPDTGRSETVVLGHDIAAGQAPQSLVPAGVWQGARLIAGGAWALLGATVAPGFDYADYAHGDREALRLLCPGQAALIDALTGDAADH